MGLQEQKTIVVQPEVVVNPPADYTWIIPGVVVPLVIALVGWFITHRRKK